MGLERTTLREAIAGITAKGFEVRRKRHWLLRRWCLFDTESGIRSGPEKGFNERQLIDIAEEAD